jgi:SAM-dependent methyltransferase
VPDLRDRQVIDLGCGEGRNTRVFARHGAQMTGIDLSPRLIEAARAAEIAEPLGIEYHIGSFSELAPFPNGNFDAAISIMAFMDGPDFYGAAREVHRVLRPGGAIYFSVIHPCFCPHGAHWVTNPDGQVVGRLVNDYWRDEPYIEKWRFSGSSEETEPFSILYFPYRLEDYLNGLCEAGFRILSIREPRPTKEMARAYPPLQREREHVPIFLYVAAAKRRGNSAQCSVPC